MDGDSPTLRLLIHGAVGLQWRISECVVPQLLIRPLVE